MQYLPKIQKEANHILRKGGAESGVMLCYRGGSGYESPLHNTLNFENTLLNKMCPMQFCNLRKSLHSSI